MRDNNEVGYGGDEQPEYDENGDLIEYYAIRPNKSQIKRDIVEIADLAEELTHLTDAQITAMEMPQVIVKSIAETKKMPATKPARKRQLKYITGHLRNMDLDKIKETLDRLKTKSAHGVREHHQAEQWRDKLIASEGNGVLTEFLNNFPAADRQHLRQLQRNAQKEAKEEKPPKASRVLYKYMKELIAG
ncbi:MAG: ribosome biogenesis factor YjgA [Methylococcaceae bacterium]